MKNVIQTLAVGLIAIAMTACGSNNSAQTAAALAAQQAAEAAQTGLSGAGGCVPLTSGVFAFTGTGVNLNPDAYLMGGYLPPVSGTPGTYGTMIMGAAGAAAGVGSVQYQPATSVNGTLQLFSGGAQSVVGSIQLSQSLIQTLIYSTGYSQYATTNASTVCVQSIAIQAALTENYSYSYGTTATTQTGIINNALIYLTLSSGQVIGPLQF
jgi:hypothetical protein